MQNKSLKCIDRPPSQFLNEFLMVDAPETYILHHHYKKDKELIEKVQRRFTKMINNMEGKSYEKKIILFETMDT